MKPTKKDQKKFDLDLKYGEIREDKIRDMLNKTYNLELKIKSNSSIDKNILLKNLIVDICNQANS